MSVDKKIKYKDIKGQKHMLAYITPGEAKTLEKLGGQKTMTPEGIPAYPPGGGDWGGSMSESGPSSDSGREGGAMANQTQSTPDTTATPPGTRHNPNHPDGFSPVSTPDTTTTTTTTPNFSIHDGPDTTPMYDDFLNVPNVTYNTGLETQRLKNIQLQNELRDATYQPPNLPFFGSTLIKTLGSFGFNKNKDFFEKNVAGKYGYGYGLSDFEKYMGDRTSGKVGAYGNENMGQNAINASSGGDNGIMDVYNAPNYTDDGDGDADGDGDVDQDDFIFRYFDKTGESLQAGAGGVEDLMAQIRKRISSIFS